MLKTYAPFNLFLSFFICLFFFFRIKTPSIICQVQIYFFYVLFSLFLSVEDKNKIFIQCIYMRLIYFVEYIHMCWSTHNAFIQLTLTDLLLLRIVVVVASAIFLFVLISSSFENMFCCCFQLNGEFSFIVLLIFHFKYT